MVFSSADRDYKGGGTDQNEKDDAVINDDSGTLSALSKMSGGSSTQPFDHGCLL